METYSRELLCEGHTFIVKTNGDVLSNASPPTSELRKVGKELVTCLRLIHKDILLPPSTQIQFLPEA